MITLQFCAFDSVIAGIIDWGTQSNVGHVDIVLPTGELLGAQHESGLGGKPPGVQIRPANYGDTCGMTNRLRVTLPASAPTSTAAYDWARSMIGTPYDLKAIEGIACNEDWSRPGYLICSGFASGMLTQPPPAFITTKLAKPWRIITPGELLILCSALAEVTPA